MTAAYSVAISFGKDLGWIEYDAEKKSAGVHIKNEEAKKKIEVFLQEKRTIGVPHASLTDFVPTELVPLADQKSFELALTRLWEATGVNVDWSRPVDYVKAHPSY